MIIRMGRLRAWLREKFPPKRKPVVVWHSWFAWRPVRITPDQWVWLERILRARFRRGDKWQYRISGEQLHKADPF